MRDAVRNGKAFGRDLALLEDRVALGTGNRQKYGSQMERDPQISLPYLLFSFFAKLSPPPYGELAQLARALAWHARGHRFDSGILHP